MNLVFDVEVWRPGDTGEQLVWCGGACPDAGVHDYRKSRQYERGEGVVGRAWESATPIAVGRDEANLAEEFGTEGVECVVALPFGKGTDCRGVVTFLCDAGAEQQGAFEIWRPNDRSELSLDDGWHANLERFGLISKHVKFPRRAGLPGKVWADRFPRVMGALSRSRDFVRAAGAKADGLSTAVGIPFMKSTRTLDSVLLLLSAAQSPIARVMEVWAADPETGDLRIVSADFGPHVDLAPMSQRLRLKAGDGIAGRVFRDQAPWLTRDLLGVEFPRGEAFSAAGFEWGVGLPVFVGEELLAVVTLLN